MNNIINFNKRHIINYPVGISIDKNEKSIKAAMREFVKREKDNLKGFDITFVCSGSSGAIISAYAYEVFSKYKLFKDIKIRVNYLDKYYVEGSEHRGVICRTYQNQKLIFLDDFSESGNTFLQVYKTYKNWKSDYEDQESEEFSGFDYIVFIDKLFGTSADMFKCNDRKLKWGKLYCSPSE